MEHGADANVVALNVANNPEIRPIEDALDEPLVQLHLFPLIPGYVDDVIYPENRPIRNQDQVDPINLEDFQRNLFELFNVREGRVDGTAQTVEVAEVIEESDDDNEYDLPAQRVSSNRLNALHQPGSSSISPQI